jgi:hypothetical protein
VGPELQLAALDRLAGSAPAAAPAAMRRRSRPALANRRLTSSATDHRKVLPLHKVVGSRCSVVKNLFAVPAHPNKNADQQHQHQIKCDFLFGVHPYVPENRSRIATVTMPRSAQTRRLLNGHRAAPGRVNERNYSLGEVARSEKLFESLAAGAIVCRSDWRPPLRQEVDEGEDSRTASLLVTTTRPMLSEKTARMGDKAKPLAAYPPTALLFVGSK